MKLLPFEHEAGRAVWSLRQSYDIIFDASQFNGILGHLLIVRRCNIAAMQSCCIDGRTGRGGRSIISAKQRSTRKAISYQSICIVRSIAILIYKYRRFSELTKTELVNGVHAIDDNT